MWYDRDSEREVYSRNQVSLVIQGLFLLLRKPVWGLPQGPVAKNLPASAGDAGLIPGRGLRSHMQRGS